MKKWGIAILIIVLIAGLYFIEISKIKTGNETSDSMPTLDELKFDDSAKNWEYFYKVRATIIDGQRAEFDIPKKLLESVGREMELSGAAVFFSSTIRNIQSALLILLVTRTFLPIRNSACRRRTVPWWPSTR